MSDPILEEEDDLISQEDIDKLLDISSGDDDSGELSQDDIDSLLDGSEQDLNESDIGEEDAGELSQDDIDSLLNDPGRSVDDSENGEKNAGELSQDDIDSLLNGADQDADVSDTGDDDELISLEDIQGAMGADTLENKISDYGPEQEFAWDAAPQPEALGAESNKDNAAKQWMEEEIVDTAPVMETSSPEEDPFDEPIDENQAVGVGDCLLTQEDLDALIEAGLPAPDTRDEVVGDDEDQNLSVGTDQTSATDDAVQEDDVTQEDIDALLQQSDEEEEFVDDDEDILISQDDINTLLMAADQEDEDVLGDIDGEDGGTELEDQFDDLESNSDQVILKGIGDAEISGGQELPEKGGKLKAFLKSKMVLAAASVLLFMGIAVPLSYFLFFSSEQASLPKKQIASLTEIDLIRDGQGNIPVDTPDLPPSRKPGTILLTDFIILASDQSRTMTYVYADVSIDYSDQRAYDEINSNLAFYRDLIYGAIQTRLVSEKNNEVTEADLLWGVEASLKKVLPPQYIDKISFKSFKAT